MSNDNIETSIVQSLDKNISSIDQLSLEDNNIVKIVNTNEYTNITNMYRILRNFKMTLINQVNRTDHLIKSIKISHRIKPLPIQTPLERIIANAERDADRQLRENLRNQRNLHDNLIYVFCVCILIFMLLFPILWGIYHI